MQHFPDSNYLDHPSHAKVGVSPFPDRLYVVTMISNPLRWRSRYANYWKFEKHVEDAGAILYTAEVAFGDRPFEVTERNNPRHLQVRTNDELWHKENAMNLIMARLPEDAKYIAWIDADVTFQRSDWAQETLHLLQHYDFIQMFSYAHDMNVHNEIVSTHTGFMYQYSQEVTKGTHSLASGKGLQPLNTNYLIENSYWHPGFAWAATRNALNKVGGLLDFAVLGSADWHMAWALIGKASHSLPDKLSTNYRNAVLEWEARANRHIQQNVGYMPGSITHSFHGSKAKRYYNSRWQLLINAKFDPLTHLKKDIQGLWQLAGNNIALRDGIRDYARLRNEDEN